MKQKRKVWYAPNKFESYGEEEIKAVEACLRDGWLAGFGPRSVEFERWRNNQNTSPKPVAEKGKIQKSNGLKNLAENNPDVERTLTDIFSAFNQD